ncbi:MAG TPA: ribonuclease P protein component [Candidatus Eisenbacteria bacterium]|jgi:ribonuclease P protein component|nr:ribonuclease P protein component [Candidatus Eisenbacteria bacterium]
MTGRTSSWLHLTVLDRSESPSRHVLHISVPKKFVPLATRRNRVKRLLREALRALPLKSGKLYQFRVRRAPKDPTLAEVKTLVKDLVQTDG